MEDADPYNKQKYEDVAREYSSGQHPQHHAQSVPAMYVKEEASSAATRYSPMKLSPTPQEGSAPYMPYTPTSQPSRQSPSRPTMLTSNSYSYYPSPSSLSTLTAIDRTNARR